MRRYFVLQQQHRKVHEVFFGARRENQIMLFRRETPRKRGHRFRLTRR